jgi:TetR/AcrR family transcriptional regulator
MMTRQTNARPRGRPRAADVVPQEAILAVALKQFAALGYDRTSIRTINRALGVSHNLILQRCGTKEDLWRAAVDYGFGGLVEQMQGVFDPTVTEPLEQLRLAIRQFLVYLAAHPELLALMNTEASQDTERLRYICSNYIQPSQAQIVRLLRYLGDEGTIRPIPHGIFFLLVTHGGAAPFTLVPLAGLLEPAQPNDPAGVEEHADFVSTAIIDGLRTRSSEAKSVS